MSKVEKQLVKHCSRGEILIVSGERPEKPLAGNRIRAEILRLLLLGGDDFNAVHEKGVIVEGAWIEGELDLTDARCRTGLDAHKCRFDSTISAIRAAIPGLYLTESSFPGLTADGIVVEGDLFLRHSSNTSEQIRIASAEISGDLSCSGGTFVCEKGVAIQADRVKVGGSIFLADEFAATGEVRLLNAEINGVLSCIGGTFSNEGGHALSADGAKVGGSIFLRDGFTARGEVRMPSADVGNTLDCGNSTFNNEGGIALNLDSANIRGGLFFRRGAFTGRIELSGAFAATLVDDLDCYSNATLSLHGFRYNHIVGPRNADERIRWLKLQRRAHLEEDFQPHPWEQLIRILRESGHPLEAARVAMAKQQALRDARQIGLRQPNPAFSGFRLTLDEAWSAFSNFLARRLHWFYGWIAGYGHRPTRIVWRMAVVCALCSLAYYGGREQGLIGPSSPVIHLNPRLARCGTGGDPGTIHWTSPNCPVPPEYSTFQPFFYSLDVLIPFVDLHQEADWGPVVTNEAGQTLWSGRVLRWIMWFEIIFGWIASVMFVAIVGRLVDKD